MAGNKEKVRVFIDANVLFAGIAFPRWPHEVLRHAINWNLSETASGAMILLI